MAPAGNDTTLCGCETVCVSYVLTALCSTVIATLTITVNSVCLYVFCQSTELRKFHGNVFIISLTVADLGNGLFNQTITAAQDWAGGRDFPQWMVTGVLFTKMLFTPMALYSLAGVSFIKLLSVKLPLRYEQLVNIRRCCICVVSIWVSIILLGITYVSVLRSQYDNLEFGREYRLKGPLLEMLWLFAVVVKVIFPTVVMVVSYAIIFTEALQQRRRVASEAVTAGNVFVQTFKSAKKLFIICLVYLVTYLPFVAAFSFNRHAPFATVIARWLFMSGAFVDNLLYIVLHKNVKKAFSDTLRSSASSQTTGVAPE